MRQDWEPEDLVAAWTLLEDDRRLIANKTGATRQGSPSCSSSFEQEGRFPTNADEMPRQAVNYVGAQVKVDASRFGDYQWAGRTIEYHRPRYAPNWASEWPTGTTRRS